MPRPRIQDIFLALPFEKKLSATSSLLMLVALFMPWYADLDTFKIGNTFTGVTGPLYLIGYTLLSLTVVSLAYVIADYQGIKLPYLKLKSSKFNLGFGIFSFYLLFVVNSIYFDHNFGINIALKQSPFGMFMAFIAAAGITVGGYLATRERTEKLREFAEDTAPLNIPVMPKMEQEKPKQNLRTVPQHIHATPVHTVHVQPHERIHVTPQQQENPINVADEVIHDVHVVHDSIPARSNTEIHRVQNQSAKNPQPIRMDL